MTPYTPDLRRRHMPPFGVPAATSSTAVSNPATTPVSNGNDHNHNFDTFIVNGGNQTGNFASPRMKHQVFTNNNSVADQSKHFLFSTESIEPSSSNCSADGTDWKRVKCVLVGDAAVGKTSLIVSYTTNGYPQEYVPTAFDNYSVSVRVDNQPIKLQLCDTAGQDDFDSLRPLCYPSTDIFLVCFSVVNPVSFQNVKQRWLPEIRQHSTVTPFILVGTEGDLRTNMNVLLDLHRYQLTPVTEVQARQMADEVGAAAYLECSSLTQMNLKETFDAAILVGLGGSMKNVQKNNPTICNGGSTVLGRKSLLKLKEKLTTSRTNSIDSMKHPNWKSAMNGGDQSERYSTHSSASHVNGRGREKKLSTASVPTTGAELNTVVVMSPDGGCSDEFYPVNGCETTSPAMKSKKGWRKLLCVA